VTVCFLRAISAVVVVFLGKFLDFWEGDLKYRDSDLIESTSLWRRLSATSDQTVAPHHKRDERVGCVCEREDNAHHKKRHDCLQENPPLFIATHVGRTLHVMN